MGQRSIVTGVKAKWGLLAHSFDTLLPKNSNFRLLLALAVAVAGISIMSPRQPQPTGPAPFSQAEQEAIA